MEAQALLSRSKEKFDAAKSELSQREKEWKDAQALLIAAKHYVSASEAMRKSLDQALHDAQHNTDSSKSLQYPNGSHLGHLHSLREVLTPVDLHSQTLQVPKENHHPKPEHQKEYQIPKNFLHPKEPQHQKEFLPPKEPQNKELLHVKEPQHKEFLHAKEPQRQKESLQPKEAQQAKEGLSPGGSMTVQDKLKNKTLTRRPSGAILSPIQNDNSSVVPPPKPSEVPVQKSILKKTLPPVLVDISGFIKAPEYSE